MADDKDLEFEDDFDDYGFGSDDDFGTDKLPDDRKPIVRATKSFIGGVGEEFTNPATIKRLTLESLPEGYAKGDKLLGEVAGVGRDLYDTTVTELKPVIRDAKRVARRALPGVKSFLPEKLAKKLEKLTADDEDPGLSSAQSREMAVQSDVANIFSAIAEQDSENRVTDEVERTRTKVEDRKKFKLEIDALSSIHSGISRLVTYQDQVTAKYQRKSLELAYLQYYTLKDTFELHRASTREQKTQLDIIAKNTALPEYQKTTMGEAAGQQFRDRLISATSARVKEAAGKYLGKYKDNIIKGGKEQLGGLKEGLMTGLSGAEMALDMQEQLADSGVKTDVASTGGKLAGNYVGGKIGATIAKIIKPFLGDMDGVKKVGAQMEYTADNLPSFIEQLVRGDAGENTRFESLGKVVRWLKEMAPNEIEDPYLDAKRETDLTKANDAVAFSHNARKSLTDIIPGFLSRIHHELAIIRTGDASISRVDYDLRDGSFQDVNRITNNLVGTLFSKENIEKTNASTDVLIGDLAGGDASKLSPEALKALKSKMIGEASRLGGRFNAKDFYDVDQWEGMGLSDEDRIALSDLFMESKDNIVLQNEHSKKFLEIREHLNNPAEAIKALSMQAGGLEHMRKAGFVIGENEDRRVDFGRITEMFNQGGYDDKIDQTANDTNVSNRLFGPVGVGGGNVGSGNHPGNSNGGGVPRSASEIKANIEECVCGDEFDRLIAAVREGNDRVVTEISKSHTENAQQAEQLAILASIYEHISSGDMMVFSVDGTDLLKSMKGKLSNRFKGMGKGISGKYQNLKNSKLGKGVGSAFNFAKNKIGSVIKSPLTTIQGAKELLSKGWGKLTDKYKEVKELYVTGELKAKLTKAKLDAKEYYDAKTGKLIEKWEDVKGPVKNAAGEWVLTAEEYSKGLWTDKGKPWKAKLTEKAKGLWDKATGLVSKPMNIISGLKDSMKAFGKTLKDAFNKPRDIYIPGREEPVILASVMAAGGYRNSDGSIISTWTDIKGTVYDLEGNVVVSLEQLKQGMMDAAGKKLELARGFLGTVVDGAKKIGGKVWGGVKKLGKSFGKLLKGGIKGLGGKLKGKFGIGGDNEMLETIGEYQILLLEEIRDATRDLKPKTIKGDKSGDGLRDGSWKEIEANRKAARDATKKDPKEKDGKEKKGFSLMGLLTTAVSMLGAIPAALMGGFGKIGSLLGGAKIASAAVSATRMAIAAAPVLMSAGGALLSGAAAVGSGLLAAGGAVLSVLSAPVVLGVAAVAALGYGAWWLYKRNKRKNRTGLMKLRMAQYGFNITDHDNIDKLLAFEDLVKPAVKSQGGDPYIDFKSLDIDKIKKMFNINDDEPESMQRFAAWTDRRFSPIYLSHNAATKSLDPKENMEEIDKTLTPEQKLKYLEIVKQPDSKAYKAVDHPMQTGALEIDEEYIHGLFTELKNEYQGALDKTKVDEADKNAAQKAKDEKRVERGVLSNAFHDSMGFVADKFMKYTPMGIVAGVAIKAAQKLIGVGKQLFSWIKGKFFTEEFKVPSILNRELDPLTSIRYRLYGIRVMEYSKVMPINKLEEILIKDVSYSGKGQAKWDGDTGDLFKKVGGLFVTNIESEETMKRWSEWFTKRFLPVFLAFLSATRGFVKNTNPFEVYELVKAPQALEIARFMASAVSNPDEKPENYISVWSIAEIPFDVHENNMDPESISPFMLLLEDDARITILAEKTNSNKGTTGAPTEAQRLTSTETAQAGANLTNSGNRSYTTPFDKAMYGNMSRSTEVGSTGGGGIVINREAKGGQWESLPGKGGPDGKYSSYKDLILGASEMAGVDPGLMAVIAGVESTFTSDAGASSSSAKGLYQFIDTTWADMLKKYGAKYGLTESASVFDPRANALMGAEYLKENAINIKNRMGREATDLDLYLSHMLGRNGVINFLKANPNEIAAKVNPSGARSNPDIFTPGGKARTVAQVHAELERRVDNWRKLAGDDARASSGMVAMERNASSPVVPGITPASSVSTGPTTTQMLMTGYGDTPGMAPGAAANGSVGVMAAGNAQGAGTAGNPYNPATTFQSGTKPTNPMTTLSQAKGLGQAMLQRDASQDDGTYGLLTLPDGSTFHTLELPWNDNKTMKSCIPPGTYNVELRNSPKFGLCYEVKNVPGRSAILIHAGNTAGNVDKGLKSDVQGCILLGLSRGRLNNQISVQDSRAALAAFQKKMGGKPFVLNIVGNAQDTAAQHNELNESVNVETAKVMTQTDLTPPEKSNASPLVTSMVGANATLPSVAGMVPGASLNATMPLPGLNVSPSPASFSPEAVEERKEAVVQQAAQVQVQAAQVQKQSQDGAVSVELLMNQQLQIQMSMDATLKNIDAGISSLSLSLGGSGVGGNSPDSPANVITTPEKAKATTASLTPIKFNRKVSFK